MQESLWPALRHAIKMILPYGIVRARQLAWENRTLLDQHAQNSAAYADLAANVAILMGAHEAAAGVQAQAIAMAQAAEASAMDADRQMFEKNEVVFEGKRIFSRSEAPKVRFRIEGEGNTIILGEPTGPGTLHVICKDEATDCTIEFGTRNRIVENVFIVLAGTGGRSPNRSEVRIGSENIFNGNVHITGGVRAGTIVKIGNSNLFANNIQIVGAIEHLIYGIVSRGAPEPEAGVVVGDRIWVCQDVLMLNKTRITSESIVGARSITNKEYGDANVVLAGIPAKPVKRGVMWHLHTTDAYLKASGPLDTGGHS